MDTSWWLALVAVVLIALIASVVDGRGRGPRRPGGRSRPPGRPTRRPAGRPSGRPAGPRRTPKGKPRPQPGEIWWADVPFEDGPGSKDRPCLVLSVRGGTVLVAKITTKNHDERPGVIPLPPDVVGDTRGRPSFLETGELRNVRLKEFRRRAAAADPALWDRVRHLAG
ncbi:type II toxin-antitoxin system PemK/MazF family toxin [Streptomyces sp. NPDC058200]|uniref:type II toxin-antitoxin system PemK/MazF family toxin n=1 Tax=Streptomyces sp. NPDC058200 TaxID=3346378 RepID=UPI0036E301F2